MADLAGVGCEILTIGQYLQPSSAHLPVERWWKPEEFTALAEVARFLGFSHVEASPLTRSSYHAARSARSAKSRRPVVGADNSLQPILERKS